MEPTHHETLDRNFEVGRLSTPAQREFFVPIENRERVSQGTISRESTVVSITLLQSNGSDFLGPWEKDPPIPLAQRVIGKLIEVVCIGWPVLAVVGVAALIVL